MNLSPLRPLAGGEEGAGPGAAATGRVRWVGPQFGAGSSPHLTPTLSAPRGLRYSHISARSSVADAFMLLEMVGVGSIDDAS